jgi:hypothetical protein
VSALRDLAVSLTRGWVVLYTLGLPADLRDGRRSEIDSDLWEQRWLAGRRREPPLATAVEIAARTLLGVISDITWRVQAGAAARADRSIKMSKSPVMRGVLGACLLLVAAVPVLSVSMVVKTLVDEPSFPDALVLIPYITVPLAGSALIVIGMLSAPERAARALGLVAAGSIMVAAAWFWLFMITIPIGLALLAVTYFRGRSAPRSDSPPPNQPQPA